MLLGEGGVDDGDRLLLVRILVGEVAAFDDFLAEHGGVIGADVLEINLGAVGVLGVLLALDLQRAVAGKDHAETVAERGGLKLGVSTQFADKFLVEKLALLGVGIVAFHQADARAKHAAGVVAVVEGLGPDDGLHLQQADNEQNARQENLKHHEALGDDADGAPGVAAAGFLEDIDGAGARGHPRRHQAGDNGGEERGGDDHGQHLGLDVEAHPGGDRIGEVARGGVEQIRGPESEGDAEDRTEAGEQQALGEHLPDEPDARGAEGGANGQFLAAQGGAGELHIHHVDAGDEQHADAEGQHDEEHLLQLLAGILFDEWPNVALGELLVGVGVGLGELFGDGVDLVLRLLDGDPGPQLADDGDEIDAPIIARLGREGGIDREPELLVGREGEFRRHDADDGGRRSVDADGAAYDARISAEVGLPQRIAQEHGLVHARAVVLGQEVAAHDG